MTTTVPQGGGTEKAVIDTSTEFGTSTKSNKPEETDEDFVVSKDSTPSSVSILQLWKYSTKLEALLTIIGLMSAAGAGAIQPSLGR